MACMKRGEDAPPRPVEDPGDEAELTMIYGSVIYTNPLLMTQCGEARASTDPYFDAIHDDEVGI